MAKTSEAQRRAVRKYQAKKKRISLDIDKNIFKVWNDSANARGMTMTAFIKEAVYARVEQGW